jgi:hypothetical protein
VRNPWIEGLARSVQAGVARMEKAGGAAGKASAVLARIRSDAMVQALTEDVGLGDAAPLHELRDEKIALQPGNVVFDLAAAAPDLFRLVPPSVQAWMRELCIDGRFPTAKLASPFETGAYFRPPSHNRAFYRRLPEGGVVAFKGSEIHAEDLGACVARMTEGRTYNNDIDRFTLGEHKIPYAASAPEMIDESRKAVALYSTMYRVYREKPDLPLPLLVVTWPESVVAAYRRVVLPKVSETTRGYLERLLRDGFGMYVYYFPRSPLRVRHFTAGDDALAHQWHGAATGPRVRAERLRVIQGWITLFTRMLCAGYFPASLDNTMCGFCVSEQNVCTEGGFVDVDSVERFENVTDPRLFAANVLLGVQFLAHAVAVYLRQLFQPTVDKLKAPPTYYGRSIAGVLCEPQIWEAVRLEYRKIVASGVSVDPRLAKILDGNPPLETMADLLTMISHVDARDGQRAKEPLDVRAGRFVAKRLRPVLRRFS